MKSIHIYANHNEQKTNKQQNQCIAGLHKAADGRASEREATGARKAMARRGTGGGEAAGRTPEATESVRRRAAEGAKQKGME